MSNYHGHDIPAEWPAEALHAQEHREHPHTKRHREIVVNRFAPNPTIHCIRERQVNLNKKPRRFNAPAEKSAQLSSLRKQQRGKFDPFDRLSRRA